MKLSIPFLKKLRLANLLIDLVLFSLWTALLGLQKPLQLRQAE